MKKLDEFWILVGKSVAVIVLSVVLIGSLVVVLGFLPVHKPFDSNWLLISSFAIISLCVLAVYFYAIVLMVGLHRDDEDVGTLDNPPVDDA